MDARVPSVEQPRVRGSTRREDAGALANHADLGSSPALRDRAPALASTAEQVPDDQIRNRRTIGGNLAEADSAADLAPLGVDHVDMPLTEERVWRVIDAAE